MADTPILDLFYMDSHDVKLMILADISQYPSGFSVVSPTLGVTVPGYKEKQIPFDAGNVNIFNSNTLRIPCHSDDCPNVDLPDGVYTFKYAVYPSYKYNVTKTIFRVDQIMAKFDEKLLSTDIFNCDSQLKRNIKMQLDEAEFYIKGAISAANRCANKLATEMYRKADSILDNIKC